MKEGFLRSQFISFDSQIDTLKASIDSIEQDLSRLVTLQAQKKDAVASLEGEKDALYEMFIHENCVNCKWFRDNGFYEPKCLNAAILGPPLFEHRYDYMYLSHMFQKLVIDLLLEYCPYCATEPMQVLL